MIKRFLSLTVILTCQLCYANEASLDPSRAYEIVDQLSAKHAVGVRCSNAGALLDCPAPGEYYTNTNAHQCLKFLKDLGHTDPCIFLNGLAESSYDNIRLTLKLETEIRELLVFGQEGPVKEHNPNVQSLVKIGAPSVPIIVEFLSKQSDDDFAIMNCLSALQGIGVRTQDVQTVMFSLLDHNDAYVRVAAAEALILLRMATIRAYDVIVAELDNDGGNSLKLDEASPGDFAAYVVYEADPNDPRTTILILEGLLLARGMAPIYALRQVRVNIGIYATEKSDELQVRIMPAILDYMELLGDQLHAGHMVEIVEIYDSFGKRLLWTLPRLRRIDDNYNSRLERIIENLSQFE